MSEDYWREHWTPEEIARVREMLGSENVPEALELFAPHDWEALYELEYTSEQFLEELAYLRRKRARWRAAAEMGFSLGEAALMGARGMMIEHEEGSA